MTSFKLSTLFPPKTEIKKLFVILLAVANTLAFLGFANSSGALVLHTTFGEILIVLAYVLAAAILESIFVLFLIVILGVILPTAWLRHKFSTNGTLIYLFGTIFLYPWIGFTSKFGRNNFFTLFENIPNNGMFLALWAIVLFLAAYLLGKSLNKPSSQEKFQNLISRLEILTGLYLAADIISILIVLIRIIA